MNMQLMSCRAHRPDTGGRFASPCPCPSPIPCLPLTLPPYVSRATHHVPGRHFGPHSSTANLGRRTCILGEYASPIQTVGG
ncbi:hypothetical protein BCR44DRAFT_1445406, partial [Catenaria anguillulae PL171]